jgi:hypothetical protein
MVKTLSRAERRVEAVKFHHNLAQQERTRNRVRYYLNISQREQGVERRARATYFKGPQDFERERRERYRAKEQENLEQETGGQEEAQDEQGSSSEDFRRGEVEGATRLARQERAGRGQIDRFGFTNQVVPGTPPPGPASGLPPPQPDPRSNPPLDRSFPIVTETTTWTGVIQEEGRFEWSRVDEEGKQEWLSAVEVHPREWRIERSKTTGGRKR